MRAFTRALFDPNFDETLAQMESTPAAQARPVSGTGTLKLNKTRETGVQKAVKPGAVEGKSKERGKRTA
jgi:hypothetical protein